MLQVSKERLKIDPNDTTALSVLSYYQYLAEDYDGAIATYERYIALLPEDAAGYNNKALVYKRRGQYAEEESLYRIALALDPDDETALNNLAVNLSHQKRFEEALAIMRHLEVIDPGDPYADLHRSKIYAEMGNDAQALAYLEKALLGMKDLDTLHHIEFRQDIRIDPSFEHLRGTRTFRDLLVRFYGKDTPLPG
jgi:tetratricopeptide (TPR) repeat protein